MSRPAPFGQLPRILVIGALALLALLGVWRASIPYAGIARERYRQHKAEQEAQEAKDGPHPCIRLAPGQVHSVLDFGPDDRLDFCEARNGEGIGWTTPLRKNNQLGCIEFESFQYGRLPDGLCDGFDSGDMSLNMPRVTFWGRKGEPPVTFRVCAGSCPKQRKAARVTRHEPPH